MANQTHIQCFLSEEQVRELVSIVIDQFGVDLSGNELIESIYLILEDIPGIEIEGIQDIHCVINQVRNLYDDKVKREYQV